MAGRVPPPWILQFDDAFGRTSGRRRNQLNEGRRRLLAGRLLSGCLVPGRIVRGRRRDTSLQSVVVKAERPCGPAKSARSGKLYGRSPQRVGDPRASRGPASGSGLREWPLRVLGHRSKRRRPASRQVGIAWVFLDLITWPPDHHRSTADDTRLVKSVHTRLPEGHLDSNRGNNCE